MKILIGIVLAISLPLICTACNGKAVKEDMNSTVSKTNSMVSSFADKTNSAIDSTVDTVSDSLNGATSGNEDNNAPNAQTVR